MAILKKQATAQPEAEFRVPSLEEASAEYAALVAQRSGLTQRGADTRAERRDIERKIAEAPAPIMRAGVAELLGETSDSTSGLRTRLAEVSKLERDIGSALEVIRQRLAVARTGASKAICAAARPEYGRRVAAICDALQAVAVARAAFDDLRDEFERQDVSWASLGPISLGFLGDARDGHIQRFVREAREAGYYG